MDTRSFAPLVTEVGRRAFDYRPARSPASAEVAIDEIPEWVREAARDAYARHERDVPVADVVFDSLLDDPQDAAGAERRLRFAGHGIEVTIAVRREAGAVALRIAVTPPGRTAMRVRHEGAELALQTDDSGQTDVSAVRPGLVSVLLTPHAGTAVRTAWLVM